MTETNSPKTKEKEEVSVKAGKPEKHKKESEVSLEEKLKKVRKKEAKTKPTTIKKETPSKERAKKEEKKEKPKVTPKEKKEIEKEPEKKEKPKEEPEVTDLEKPKGTLLDRVRLAKETKKRNFTQSWDLAINLKNIDLKKPENRFNTQILLPGGRGKDVKIAIIADSLAGEAEKAGADLIIKKNQIDTLAKDKKKLKKIADEYEWFFGEITLMAAIGKQLGIVLGPRGKMPRPIPPKIKIEPFIKAAKNSVRIAVKESPVVHVTVGSENIDDQNVVKNIEAVFNLVKDKLPKGKNNIRSLYIKLTMGKAVKLEMM